MHPPTSSFKHEFLKKWVLGLQFYNSSTKDMSFLERKKAIKLSSDVAMASARDGNTTWGRALIANSSKQDENKNLVRKIVGVEIDKLTKPSIVSCNKRVRSRKIFIRSCKLCRKSKSLHRRVLARNTAKRIIKKKTQVLQGLVPGGESMDNFSLFEETLDYILSLQVQVDVMQRVCNASENSNGD